MKYIVDQYNNFLRVFELPQGYPRGFCFDGGYPVTIKMVDWFNPCQFDNLPLIIEDKEIDKLIDDLTEFITNKAYYDKNKKYLIIADFNLSFIIEKQNIENLKEDFDQLLSDYEQLEFAKEFLNDEKNNEKYVWK